MPSPSEVMLAPSIDHLLGTDELGRDVLLSIVHGIKVSLSVGFAAALGATVIGILVGSMAGFYGGVVDLLFMRISEIFQVVPSFILAAVIVALSGPGLLAGGGRDLAPCLAAGGAPHARRGDAHQAAGIRRRGALPGRAGIGHPHRARSYPTPWRRRSQPAP